MQQAASGRAGRLVSVYIQPQVGSGSCQMCPFLMLQPILLLATIGTLQTRTPICNDQNSEEAALHKSHGEPHSESNFAACSPGCKHQQYLMGAPSRAHMRLGMSQMQGAGGLDRAIAAIFNIGQVAKLELPPQLQVVRTEPAMHNCSYVANHTISPYESC